MFSNNHHIKIKLDNKTNYISFDGYLLGNYVGNFKISNAQNIKNIYLLRNHNFQRWQHLLTNPKNIESIVSITRKNSTFYEDNYEIINILLYDLKPICKSLNNDIKQIISSYISGSSIHTPLNEQYIFSKKNINYLFSNKYNKKDYILCFEFNSQKNQTILEFDLLY